MTNEMNEIVQYEALWRKVSLIRHVIDRSITNVVVVSLGSDSNSSRPQEHPLDSQEAFTLRIQNYPGGCGIPV